MEESSGNVNRGEKEKEIIRLFRKLPDRFLLSDSVVAARQVGVSPSPRCVAVFSERSGHPPADASYALCKSASSLACMVMGSRAYPTLWPRYSRGMCGLNRERRSGSAMEWLRVVGFGGFATRN